MLCTYRGAKQTVDVVGSRLPLYHCFNYRNLQYMQRLNTNPSACCIPSKLAEWRRHWRRVWLRAGLDGCSQSHAPVYDARGQGASAAEDPHPQKTVYLLYLKKCQ
jgi:hypothetical protein